MPVDPTDPDTFEDDTYIGEFDVEAPEAEAAEHHAGRTLHRDRALIGADPAASNEADLAEQARVVELDEDEYR
ncbi:hypothetical protein ACFC18_44870 [Streptomyces sp. NPDC056121]|uniref:hypothetical protein n=1 Tax=unclassified Streptomyces TaxID=2593676 RepID=UPI0030C90D0E